MNPIDLNPQKNISFAKMDPQRSIGKGQELPHNDTARDLALKKTSRDLEASFLTFMVRAMEKTVPKSGLLESKNSLSSMMFSSVIAQSMAKQGGTGIAEMIYKSLSGGAELPKSLSGTGSSTDYSIQAIRSSLTSVEP